MTATRLQVRAAHAGYGGGGPATPAPHPDLRVVLLVELEASARLEGVEVRELELLDAAGRVVARAAQPLRARREWADTARGRYDFGEGSSAPFDGALMPGRPLRLVVEAPVDVRAEALAATPVRVRGSLGAVGEPGVALAGPLEGPWPTG